MKNITSEQIYEIALEAHSLMSKNTISKFSENVEAFQKVFKEENTFSNDADTTNAAIYFAVIKTLQDGFVIALNSTLIKLLCDESD